jgi:hypothetical protein
MLENMTVEDAINVVHVLGRDLASNGNEDLGKLVSAATWLVSHAQEQAAELERERARRQGIGPSRWDHARRTSSREWADGGGRRDLRAAAVCTLARRCTSLRTATGTRSGTSPTCRAMSREPCLYLPLPGVREDVVFWGPTRSAVRVAGGTAAVAAVSRSTWTPST